MSVILTHVEFDHADIYRDLDAVKTAFKRLVNLVPRRGRIVAFDGSANVSECVAKAFCQVERYGFGEELAVASCGSEASRRHGPRWQRAARWAGRGQSSSCRWPANTTR